MRITFALSVLLLCSTAHAAGELVQAKLLADVSAIQAGKAFTVGILLTIQPGWHVYWKNPGDSGLPTRVKFDLPEGFDAGEIQFPTPKKMIDAGGLVSYGYQDQVLLTSTITPSAAVKLDQNVVLAATVKWLCCQTDCRPGQSQAKLQLPVSDTATADNAGLFRQWRRQVPVADGGLSVSGPLDLALPEPSVTLSPQETGAMECIPGAIDGINLTVSATNGGKPFVLKAAKLEGQAVTAKSVEVLITRPDPSGVGRLGISVQVPIVNGDKHATTAASP